MPWASVIEEIDPVYRIPRAWKWVLEGLAAEVSCGKRVKGDGGNDIQPRRSLSGTGRRENEGFAAVSSSRTNFRGRTPISVPCYWMARRIWIMESFALYDASFG